MNQGRAKSIFSARSPFDNGGFLATRKSRRLQIQSGYGGRRGDRKLVLPLLRKILTNVADLCFNNVVAI